MIVRSSRRLAGFRFETQSPLTDDVLPRMDVAVFVGFALSGPLHTPVSVDSPAQFADIFGADAALAWDPERSEPAYAHLAPAVRAFFRNGGRRCWVVRVAGAAVENLFAVPGLAWLNSDGTIIPAFVRARSEGSWSDGLRVAATLEQESLRFTSVDAASGSVRLDTAGANKMAVGDLLRLRFDEHRCARLFAVTSLQTPVEAAAQDTVAVDAQGDQSVWLRAPGGSPPRTAVGEMVSFTQAGPRKPIAAYVPHISGASPMDPTDSTPPWTPLWPTRDGEQTVGLDVPGSLADAPRPGAMVRFEFDGDIFWLVVNDVAEIEAAGAPPERRVRLTGQGCWQLSQPPSDLPAAPTSVERLTFDLWVRRDAENKEYPARLRGLGFATGHSLFWNALPTDSQFFAELSPPSALKEAVASPRFPLAGGVRSGRSSFSLPLAMEFIPTSFVGPERVTKTALERDGLERFDARLFLGGDDRQALCAFLEAGTARVMEVADHLRYHAPQPQSLRGIYAALAIDEATLIAAPDMLHRGWERPPPEPAPTPPAHNSTSPAEPRTTFAPCGKRAVDAPVLNTDAPLEARGLFHEAIDGTFSLKWSPVQGADFELQESARHDFTDATTLYAGRRADRFDIYGRRGGDFYYRLRFQMEGRWTDWSQGLVVRVVSANDWRLIPALRYEDTTLLVVQRALLRMCAGRGDLLAVLALPSHYREDEAIQHVRKLVSNSGPDLTITLSGADDDLAQVEERVACRRLSDAELATASYGALYHPWLMGREEGSSDLVRLTPPEGAVSGIMAKRALSRGAWVAPANEPLAGPVVLSPTIPPERQLDLLDAQVNLIRDEPGGFLVLSADTLSSDDALRPINVRRLLILLRRLALRQGADYVFEPNDDSFLRAVQRSFESILEFMFVRGAFAGRTPAASFQVITGSAVNTPRDRDQGLFFVELRVAPSLPLTFLTVRLVQTGECGAITEGR